MNHNHPPSSVACTSAAAIGFVLMILFSWIQPVAAQDSSEDLPELDPFIVEADGGPIGPRFQRPSPSFTYFNQEKLTNGTMIYALEFMDRYRELPVPGNVKWAGILYFPWVDGFGNGTLQYLCLYMYADRMYGFNPSMDAGYQRRFFVPLRYGDRTNRERLYRFAKAFVEGISPAREEMILVPGALESFGEEEDAYAEVMDEYEYIEIDAGRIEGFLPSDRNSEAEDLVHLIYQMQGDPDPTAPTEIGKVDAPPARKFKFSKIFSQPIGVQRDFAIARELLEPRWAQRVIINYQKDTFFFGEVTRKRQVLLFNIGQKIYAYYPRFGVWRTEATLEDIMTPGAANGKVTYPGGIEDTMIQFLPWESDEKAS